MIRKLPSVAAFVVALFAYAASAQDGSSPYADGTAVPGTPHPHAPDAHTHLEADVTDLMHAVPDVSVLTNDGVGNCGHTAGGVAVPFPCEADTDTIDVSAYVVNANETCTHTAGGVSVTAPCAEDDDTLYRVDISGAPDCTFDRSTDDGSTYTPLVSFKCEANTDTDVTKLDLTLDATSNELCVVGEETSTAITGLCVDLTPYLDNTDVSAVALALNTSGILQVKIDEPTSAGGTQTVVDTVDLAVLTSEVKDNGDGTCTHTPGVGGAAPVTFACEADTNTIYQVDTSNAPTCILEGSNDQGATWVGVTKFPCELNTDTLYQVDSSNAPTCYLEVSTDDGTTWSQQNKFACDVSRYAADFTAGTKIGTHTAGGVVTDIYIPTVVDTDTTYQILNNNPAAGECQVQSSTNAGTSWANAGAAFPCTALELPVCAAANTPLEWNSTAWVCGTPHVANKQDWSKRTANTGWLWGAWTPVYTANAAAVDNGFVPVAAAQTSPNVITDVSVGVNLGSALTYMRNGRLYSWYGYRVLVNGTAVVSRTYQIYHYEDERVANTATGANALEYQVTPIGSAFEQLNDVPAGATIQVEAWRRYQPTACQANCYIRLISGLRSHANFTFLPDTTWTETP